MCHVIFMRELGDITDDVQTLVKLKPNTRDNTMLPNAIHE